MLCHPLPATCQLLSQRSAMSKKVTFLAVSATLLSVVAAGVAGMAWYQSWLNQPLAELPDEAVLEIGDVAGVTAQEGDVALDLTPIDAGGNTQTTWRCGKVLAGTRFDYTGAWTRLAGRVLIDPKTRALRAGELRIAVNAMRGHGEHPAPNAMINTVRDNEWFTTTTPRATTPHATTPQAVFATQGFEVRADDERASFGGAVEGWTHKLLCKLQLNGVEQEMTVFARMQVGEQSLHLDATFPISRAAFKVAKRKGFEPPAEVDDQVLIDIKIHATPDPLAVIADLNRELVAQQAKSGELAAQIKTLTTRLDRIETSSAELQRELQALAAAGTSKGAVDIASLPKSFTDHVDYQNARGDDNIVDLGYEVPFEMILIPGDAEQGIQPFYVQKTEATWQMFRAWSYCTDIEDPLHAATLKDDLLRPTPCYEDASRGHGFDGKAVLGVSRRNAEAFCRPQHRADVALAVVDVAEAEVGVGAEDVAGVAVGARQQRRAQLLDDRREAACRQRVSRREPHETLGRTAPLSRHLVLRRTRKLLGGRHVVGGDHRLALLRGVVEEARVHLALVVFEGEVAGQDEAVLVVLAHDFSLFILCIYIIELIFSRKAIFQNG